MQSVMKRTSINADTLRNQTHSLKWNIFADDTLAAWVADMDFPCAEEIQEALAKRAQIPTFTYEMYQSSLIEAAHSWIGSRYQWNLKQSAIIPVPGMVATIYQLCRQWLKNGSTGIMMPSPIYPPLYSLPPKIGVHRYEILWKEHDNRYMLDYHMIEDAARKGCRILLLCNPHNPHGHVFSLEELKIIADLIKKYQLYCICDEIWSDLVYAPSKHLPLASLDTETADRTVTLIAPGKTFNIAGISLAFMLIPNTMMRKELSVILHGELPEINAFSLTAAYAAYTKAERWYRQCLKSLKDNKAFVTQWLKENMPWVSWIEPEGTYLLWMNFSKMPREGDPYRIVLREGKVALNNGRDFGTGGEGYLRLNFATSQEMLEQILGRMKKPFA